MTAIVFNAETYADTLRSFGNSCRTMEGKADNYARTALAALVTESLSAMGLAASVYAEMEPKKADGKLAEPKESEKAPMGVSVSSLRSAKGGEGARSALEAILYVAENRSFDGDAVADFILGKRNAFRLFPLKKHLQAEKAKAAKAEAETVAGASDSEEPKEGLETVEASNPVRDAIAFLQGLDGEALIALEGDIAALLEEARSAAERIAAAETVRTGTEG